MTTLRQRAETIFREALETDDLVLSDDLSAKNTAAWDSFAHVKLMVGLEEEFGVKFTTHEVASIHNAGELMRSLEAKLQDR